MKEEIQSLAGFYIEVIDGKFYLWDDVLIRYVDKIFETREEALNWIQERFCKKNGSNR